MKTFLLILAAVVLSILPARAAEKAPKLPEYPNQPYINSALKQLTNAQEKLSSDQADALTWLKKAQITLEGAIKDKGSFRATAIRMTKQAIRHLENNDPATAAHEIEEAIENAHRAGKQGGR